MALLTKYANATLSGILVPGFVVKAWHQKNGNLKVKGSETMRLAVRSRWLVDGSAKIA
jgi:hypothetical protein